MGKTYRAFTSNFNQKVNAIITEIGISVPFEYEPNIQKDDERINWTKALWDTGATHSVITRRAAEKLGLPTSGVANTIHAGGCSQVNVYKVHIYLPNDIIFAFHRVTECSDLNDDFDVIIGMDIIAQGDFALTNMNNATTFSVRIPSMQKIDYVKELDNIKKQMYKNVGRNDKCPCGSGKKYKICCGV